MEYEGEQSTSMARLTGYNTMAPFRVAYPRHSMLDSRSYELPPRSMPYAVRHTVALLAP